MGIVLALAGAICLAIGTEVQNRGVRTTSRGRGARGFLALIANPVWVGGTALVIISIFGQLGSLLLAPLVVVQPLGVVGLLVTSFLQARRSHTGLASDKKLGVALCMVGLAVFVTIATIGSREEVVTTTKVIVVLALLVAVAVGSLLLHRVNKSALAYSLAGAVMFGFLATLAQIVLKQVVVWHLSPLTFIEAAAALFAMLIGAFWVANAQSKGTSTLVLAGLTVVDPLTGVLITGIVFGALGGASTEAVFGMLLAGIAAGAGVLLLSRD